SLRCRSTSETSGPRLTTVSATARAALATCVARVTHSGSSVSATCLTEQRYLLAFASVSERHNGDALPRLSAGYWDGGSTEESSGAQEVRFRPNRYRLARLTKAA